MADDEQKVEHSTEMRRRDALVKLGLGAVAAYAAPIVLHIDRGANATILPTPCHFPGKGRSGPKKCPPGHRKPVGPQHKGHTQPRPTRRDRG